MPLVLNSGAPLPTSYSWSPGVFNDYPVKFHTGRWLGFSMVVIRLTRQEFTIIILSEQENFRSQPTLRVSRKFVPSGLKT